MLTQILMQRKIDCRKLLLEFGMHSWKSDLFCIYCNKSINFPIGSVNWKFSVFDVEKKT